MVFVQFFGSTPPICSMILHTPIPTVFFPSFLTWGFHNHFAELGTRQGDPLRGALFTLVHLRTLRLIVVAHPICVFLSLADDTHIIDFASNVVLTFL
jgi:hypothetical protein